MNELIDNLIKVYALSKKRKQIMKREIEDFMRFYNAFCDTRKDKKDKYLQNKIVGLSYIQQNKKLIYDKINEEFFSIHFRSKSNQSIR
jgi:predicted transcriptional regulator